MGSCGGLPGISDLFSAVLRALDYALQMAYANFSGALFHIAGQNSSLNVRRQSRLLARVPLLIPDMLQAFLPLPSRTASEPTLG